MRKDRKGRRETKTLRRVAYHEAGHVAVALRERISIREVTIIPSEGYLGLARNYHPPSFLRAAEYGDLSSRHVESFVLVCLAGAAAEKRFCGRYDHIGAGADYKAADDMLSRHAGGRGLGMAEASGHPRAPGRRHRVGACRFRLPRRCSSARRLARSRCAPS